MYFSTVNAVAEVASSALAPAAAANTCTKHPVVMPSMFERDAVMGLFWDGKLRGRQLAAEGGHFDRLGAEADVSQPEAPSNDPAILEKTLDLIRMRVGADVEILGTTAEQQVADAAADQIRDVIVLAKAIEDLQRVRIDVAARDWMLGARDDPRCDHGTALYQTRKQRALNRSISTI